MTYGNFYKYRLNKYDDNLREKILTICTSYYNVNYEDLIYFNRDLLVKIRSIYTFLCADFSPTSSRKSIAKTLGLKSQEQISVRFRNRNKIMSKLGYEHDFNEIRDILRFVMTFDQISTYVSNTKISQIN